LQCVQYCSVYSIAVFILEELVANADMESVPHE